MWKMELEIKQANLLVQGLKIEGFGKDAESHTQIMHLGQ